MRICYTSDLHGRPNLYDQIDELLLAEHPAALILGGDLFADGDHRDPIPSQLEHVDEIVTTRFAAWRRRQPDLQIVCLIGNHDWLAVEARLRSHMAAGQLVYPTLDAPVTVAGLPTLGYGHTPWTPHVTKDFERLDLPEDTLPTEGGLVCDPDSLHVKAVTAEKYFRHQPSLADELAEAAVPPGPWLFICHAPPFETYLDRLPTVEHPIGSRAVRRFIEAHQPLVALHGHIHESPEVTGHYVDRIGQTLCINPGQDHDRLHAAIFDTDDPAGTLSHTVLK